MKFDTTPYLTDEQVTAAMLNVDDPLQWANVKMTDDCVQMLSQFARALELAVRMNLAKALA